jgi:GH25 family lysozyme M1 (1,4-beta-N-acetylmuramidase)
MFAAGFLRRLLPVAAIIMVSAQAVHAEAGFSQPWNAAEHALVIDAYEFNELNLADIAADKRVAGFINKGSDGMPPAWGCKTAAGETEKALCKTEWQLYSVSRELFHTRKELAKALGLKWGSYHLGRPGNAIDQANHFIDFTDPQPDELIAIDIEDVSSGRYISLEDAELFARHIYRRLGRYPVLYVNDDTAKHIARVRYDYPLLSRLPLWYARYQPEIAASFPKGNWDGYSLWQFVSHLNCNKLSCPRRVGGTNRDIDINVASMSVQALKAAWPLGGLVPTKDPKSDVEFSQALVAITSRKAGSLKPLADAMTLSVTRHASTVVATAIEHASSLVDPVVTVSIAFNRRSGRAD